jgi:hypothetical protein
MERNWNTTDDYEAIVNGSTKFEDVNFPVNDALFWPQFNEGGSNADTTVQWNRVSEHQLFSDKKFFGNNGADSITVKDINQGAIGNCWI